MPLVLPRRSLNLDFVRDGQASGDNYPTELSKLDGLLTFARSTTATRFNSAGTLETVAAGQPRFDFDPLTLACKGLLIEEARTNLLLQSEDMTNGAWVLYNGATYVGGLLSDTSVAAESAIYQSVTVPNDSLTRTAALDIKGYTNGITTQIYLPYGGGTPVYAFVNISWAAGVPSISGINGGEATLKAVGGGYYRLTMTSTNNNSGNTQLSLYIFPCVSAANTGGIYVRRPQLETGAFATSYIPTTTAAVTRAAESCSITSLTPWFNTAAGTWLADVDSFSDAAATAFILNGRNGPVLLPAIYKSTSGTARVRAEWYDGVTDHSFYSTAVWGATAIKAALAYSGSTKKFSVSGEAAQTATAAMSVSPTTFYLGSQDGTTDFLNGHLRRLSYLPYSVSDALLQALST